MRSLRIAALLVLVVAVLAAVAVKVAVERYEGPGPLDEETVVEIPRGADLEEIARRLAEAGVIDRPLLFRLAVRLDGQARSLKAGEYRFTPAMSMKQAADLLVSGRTVLHALTVPEGLTSTAVVELINGTKGLVGEIEQVPPEGSLLPETYHYARGDSRRELLDRMSAALERTLQELWTARVEGLPLDNPEEALILASIVEKETALAEERPVVASVFINRLRRGMPLQSDPTVIFSLTEGKDELGRRLTRADLKVESPFNTYRIGGLPPAPIANPGRDSIAAVLNPAETDYLYFVADGSGGHAFAETLAGHNRNVARWRKLRRSGTSAGD